MVTQNRARENAAFSPPPKVRMHVPQDVFLQNNKYLVGQNIKFPRGGSCEGMDTSIFFPVFKDGKYSGLDRVKQKQAVEICRGCKIRSECLLYSLEYEPHGIWGGFPEQTRALLAKFWGIINKRGWTVRQSFLRHRKLVDYIVTPIDIEFIRKTARDENLAQPPFNERAGLSATARRRISQGVAY